MDKRTLFIILLIVLLLIVIGFGIGRITSPTKIITIIPNDYVEKKKADSLESLLSKSEDSVKKLNTISKQKEVDLIINDKNVKNEVKRVKNFPPNYNRSREMDSIYRANIK